MELHGDGAATRPGHKSMHQSRSLHVMTRIAENSSGLVTGRRDGEMEMGRLEGTSLRTFPAMRVSTTHLRPRRSAASFSQSIVAIYVALRSSVPFEKAKTLPPFYQANSTCFLFFLSSQGLHKVRCSSEGESCIIARNS